MDRRIVLEFLRKKQKEGVKYILLDCGDGNFFKKSIEKDFGNLKKVTLQDENILVFETVSEKFLLNADFIQETWGLVK